MHHQLNRHCPVLQCRLCGRARLGAELRDGGVDGAADVTDGHVLAHGAQTYVNVWPPAARGGDTDINANEGVRIRVCYLQWSRNLKST